MQALIEAPGFFVMGEGLLYMTVCTSLTDEEALERANIKSHPVPVAYRWQIDDEPPDESAEIHGHSAENPSPCPDSGNRHIRFAYRKP